MPQHTQHFLVHILLFWTTVLSIIQIAFVVMFFTNGHMSQNTNAVAAERKKQTQANNASSFSPGRGPPFGKMLFFTAKEENTVVKNISWKARNPDEDLVSHQESVLTLMKDGYYFLNLQVTLSSPVVHTTRVSLLWNSKVLLEGWINKNSRSTGLLGKAELLSAGGMLWVSIDPQPAKINDTESVTHLDIIYMQKY